MTRRRKWPEGVIDQWQAARQHHMSAIEHSQAARKRLHDLDDLLRRTLHEPAAHALINHTLRELAELGEDLAHADRYLLLARMGEPE